MEAARSYWLDVSCRKPSFPLCTGLVWDGGGERAWASEGSRGQRDLQIYSLFSDALSGPALPISKRFRCESKNKFTADQLWNAQLPEWLFL